MNDEEKKITELVKERFDNATDILSDVVSGVPAHIKALAQLCTAATDIPNS